MSIRKMCDSCSITDTYEQNQNICKTCNRIGLQPSENFEDAYGIHNLNKQVRDLLAYELDKIDAEIADFEENWFKTWNAEGPTQMSWQTPENYSHWLKVLQDE